MARTNPIGIMQGRLSLPRQGMPQYFPIDSWKQEFRLAQECGFDAIEWLFDTSSRANNPILSHAGRQQILRLAQGNNIRMLSLCADYFKDYSLATNDDSLRSERASFLVHLLEASAKLGIECVLVPFLENSSIKNPADRALANSALSACLDAATSFGISLVVETDLPAAELADWLADMAHPALGVYYDLGNAVASGCDPVLELPILATWLRGVHIKDRTRNGPNVPLGTGAVNFAACFRALARMDYQGPLILETVRGSDYINDAKRHLEFVVQQLDLVKQEQART